MHTNTGGGDTKNASPAAVVFFSLGAVIMRHNRCRQVATLEAARSSGRKSPLLCEHHVPRGEPAPRNGMEETVTVTERGDGEGGGGDHQITIEAG